MVSSVNLQPSASQAAAPASPADVPRASGAIEAAGSASSAPASSQVAHANPSYQFNAAAGVVVIQFRDDSGKVALSIPNQQQLKAYAAQRSGEPTPAGDSPLVT